MEFDNQSKSFNPIKFHFDEATDDSRYYIYSIRNREKDKFYIGISRHPAQRINKQLKDKKHLSDDYAKAAQHCDISDTDNHVFEFGLLNAKGYPSPLIGCIAEVLYMIQLEDHGIEIYNQNKFGGHPDLNDQKDAFYGIVKIVDKRTNALPSAEEILAIEKALPEIKHYIDNTSDNDIINSDLILEIKNAWQEHKHRQETGMFGTLEVSTIDTNKYLINYTRLTPIPSNDNTQGEQSPSLIIIENTPHI